MYTLSIYLDEQTNEHLQSYCQYTGTTYNEVIKTAITALIIPNTSPVKLAETLNLIACFDSDISDLGYIGTALLRSSA